MSIMSERLEILENFEAKLEALNEAAKTVKPCDYVVGCSGLYVTPELNMAGLTTGKFQQTATPHEAKLLSKRYARKLASVTFNGHNEQYEAVPLAKAIERATQGHTVVIQMILDVIKQDTTSDY